MNKLLAIDKGNTRTKVGLYTEGKPLKLTYWDSDAEDDLLHYIKHHSCTHAMISNVAGNSFPLVHDWLKSHVKLSVLNTNTRLPIQIEYDTPETLGADRIAGAVAGWSLSKRKNVIVVDAGTCVNIELVINNTYLGGSISPGLSMRFQALHHFTGKLPLLKLPVEDLKLVGTSTVSSIGTGTIWGIIDEIDGKINRYKEEFGDFEVFLTGGDAEYLGKYLKNSIFARPEMVIEGLIEILKFQLNENK